MMISRFKIKSHLLNGLLGLMVFLFTIGFQIGCGGDKSGSSSSSGKDKTSPLIKLIPKETSGIFAFNVKNMADKSILDTFIGQDQGLVMGQGNAFKNYQDFVDKTGVDFKKNIYSVIMALSADFAEKKAEPTILVHGDFSASKSKILDTIKQQAASVKEDSYQGIAIFQITEKENAAAKAVSFLNDDIMCLADSDALKKVIDLFKGNGECINKNEKMKPYMDKFNPAALLSMAFVIPDQIKNDVQKQTEGSPFSFDISKAEALTGEIDYNDKALNGLIRLISPNPEGNNKTIGSLNMLKGMGAVGGPEIVELLNNVNFTASDADITLTFKITEELMNKLKNKFQAKNEASPDTSVVPN